MIGLALTFGLFFAAGFATAVACAFATLGWRWR